ncbi:MAG: class I SAM-dependent methyltransferase [Candidatus Obscuribacterales bacterium]|jgi:2-polyprenyl-3-methyl-5-hydroxy-6-metoxy-1,4-benzoquinol methylase
MSIDFQRAREETLQYHKAYYSRFKLFEKDSWLENPDQPLMRLLDYLDGQIKILDLGCGVGRNAIPMAQALQESKKNATITCVDVLAESIDLLKEYATTYKVEEIIDPVLSDNDQFVIEPNTYDLIAGISTLEHCQGKNKVAQLMAAIAKGTKSGGFVRIEMTTNRRVIDTTTNLPVPTFVETPLDGEEVQEMLQAKDTFAGWNIISLTIDPYEEELAKEDRTVHWCSTQINFTAQKP